MKICRKCNEIINDRFITQCPKCGADVSRPLEVSEVEYLKLIKKMPNQQKGEKDKSFLSVIIYFISIIVYVIILVSYYMNIFKNYESSILIISLVLFILFNVLYLGHNYIISIHMKFEQKKYDPNNISKNMHIIEWTETGATYLIAILLLLLT